MKATTRTQYCSPEKIIVKALNTPTIKENELFIKIHNTTVNRTDCAILTAKPFIMRLILGLFKPKKIILGTDFSGEVITAGNKVKNIDIGTKIFGFNDIGFASQATHMVTTANKIFPIPSNINFKQAAASLEGAHYAYSFIKKAQIKSGQHILINGASGGIGSALIQFASQYDIKITATCATKNIELIKSLGAHRVIDYLKEDFTSDAEKFDFIFDTVGKSTFSKCKPLLKPRGTYISSELGPYFQNLFYPLLTLFSNKKVIFPIPYPTNQSIPFIIDVLKNNTFKPVIDQEFTLDNIAKAYSYVIKGEKTGNVIINISDVK